MMQQANNGYELLDIKNIVQISTHAQAQCLLYLPNLNSTYKMSTIEIRSFQLKSMRWLSEMEDSKFSFKIRPQYVKIFH